MTTPPFRRVGEPTELYRGRLLRIAAQRMAMPDGRQQIFEYAERAPGVRILVTDLRRILLSREWRSEIGAWDYRLPGGKVFDSLEEYLAHVDLPLDEMARFARTAAQKELREETSIHLPPESFELLHRSICGATVVWDLYYYKALVNPEAVAAIGAIETDEGEQTRPEWCDNEAVLTLCLQRHVSEDRTVAVLLTHLLGNADSPALPSPTG